MPAVQAIASTPPSAEARAAAQPGCGPTLGSTIVVCGERRGESPYRLPTLPTGYDRKAIRAETTVIPGVDTSVHADSVARPDGYRDQRLMVTFKLPF